MSEQEKAERKLERHMLLGEPPVLLLAILILCIPCFVGLAALLGAMLGSVIGVFYFIGAIFLVGGWHDAHRVILARQAEAARKASPAYKEWATQRARDEEAERVKRARKEEAEREAEIERRAEAKYWKRVREEQRSQQIAAGN